MPKVSVIVLTYNAVWEKLRATVKSILDQTYADFEIVFADDGSERKWHREIEAMMAERPELQYRFADSEQNVGTVKNAYRALNAAVGEYVKLISPGDCFFDTRTLSKWVAFMETSKAELTFGEAAYYRFEDGSIRLFAERRLPSNAWLYHGRKHRRDLLVDYLLLGDTILGSAVMVRRLKMIQYLEPLLGRVKYGEDRFMTLMIFKGETIQHYSNNVLWYEFGTGISSRTKLHWRKILLEERDETDRILAEMLDGSNALAARIVRCIQICSKRGAERKVVKCLMFPTIVKLKLKKIYSPRTPVDVDTQYIRSLYTAAEERVDQSCR